MAQHIPQEIIEEVRQQSNIVDVVSQYVQLKKSGKNYFGLCPFHEEKSPSFSVAEDKQIYYCFGCGKGGNVFQFVQDVDGVSFPESVSKVADIGHIQVDFDLQDEGTSEEREQVAKQDSLIKLHEKAVDVYHHILLNTEAGEKALDYLLARGMTHEQIVEFKLGFAPHERIVLKKIFENESVPDELLDLSGLMTQLDNGEWLDRFYQRIMFPIRNAQGKTVAFSGRILERENFDSSKAPKYLNSPETQIFNKRMTLFNFDKARVVARKENEIVLFEGFMDVIAASSANVKNGVASMGTSLTNEQIQMIQRVASNVLVCYDGDSAGIEATNRALHLLSENTTLNLSVLSLPEKLDPDDYIRKYGSEEFTNKVKNGRDTEFTFKMKYHKTGKNLNNEQDRFDYIQNLIDELVRIPSVIEREVYINQLSEEFDISVESINEEIRGKQQAVRQEQKNERYNRKSKKESRPEVVVPQEFQTRSITSGEKAEQMLLFRIMHERGVQSRIHQIEDFSFIHDEYQELYDHFTDYMVTHGNFEAADFINYIKEDYLKQTLVKISYIELSEDSSIKEIDDYILALTKERLEQKKQKKITEQKEASRVGDKQREQELAIEIINIQRKLKSV